MLPEELRMQRMTSGERKALVYCSQWASCGWRGYREFGVGKDPVAKPCPKCGHKVAA